MPVSIPASQLPDLVGMETEPSSWLRVTQERINQFADATNDHQFIHVSPMKALLTPFRSTIAHGFLSLSLLSHLNAETAYIPDSVKMVINYGSDRVRYLAPVKVGRRIRSHQKIIEANEKKPGQWLVKTEVTIEIEDEDTPALVAEILTLFILK